MNANMETGNRGKARRTCGTCRWYDGALGPQGRAARTIIGGGAARRRRENPVENKPEPHVCGVCRNYDALLDACREGGSVRENRGDCGKWEKGKIS